MRAAGYRTVDAAARLARRRDATADQARDAGRDARSDSAARRRRAGEPFDEILAGLFRDVIPFASRSAHPRFFAFVPFAGTWPGALGDFIASACNLYAGSWMESAGPTQLELELLAWFKDWIGYPAEAGGSLVTGGSAANLTALVCAREARRPVAKRRPRRLRLRPGALVDRTRRAHPRLRPRAGARAPGGRRPAARAGDARRRDRGRRIGGQGAVLRRRERRRDELRRDRPAAGDRRALPARTDLWLHVDAAYGGFAVLTERGRRALDGIALARLDHARPAQVALPAVRVRLPARARRPRA